MSRNSESPEGQLVIVSGPAGVGKSSVAERLVKSDAYERIVTATTRQPRPGERDGVDYHFLSTEEFGRWVDEGRFLEHATVHDRFYGTPREAVVTALETGRNVVLTIDVQGARQIREREAALEPLTIFLLAPSHEELLRRLTSRDSESEAEIRTRLETAEAELAAQCEYDERVVNERLEDCVARVESLVEARRRRRSKKNWH